MWGAHEGMGWWMVFGGVVWVLFIGALVYLASGASGRDRSAPEKNDTPLDVAKRRYAAGEISEAEFERIREKLG